VVPLFPEFIAPQDGAEKQDCERNAVKRWHAKLGERLSWLRPIYLGDDLFACQPIVTMLTDTGDDFIFTCKHALPTATCSPRSAWRPRSRTAQSVAPPDCRTHAHIEALGGPAPRITRHDTGHHSLPQVQRIRLRHRSPQAKRINLQRLAHP
jgi:hypothetical protein